MVYNENTLEEYRKLLKTWLAVRKARLEKSPASVRMEEEIESREGIADYIQTAPFRVADSPGAEKRPELETLDPFFERYRNFVMLRVNILNYPLSWSPTDPADGLAQARARGALLAFVAMPVMPRWTETYFPPGGEPPRSWRELLEPALYKEAPPDRAAEAKLLEETKQKEGFDRLSQVIQGAMDEKAAAPASAGEGAPALSLNLTGRKVLAWEASPNWSWVGPGRVEVAGPLLLRFEGGELRLGGDARALFVAGQGSGGVEEVRLELPPAEKKMTCEGKGIDWPAGRKTLSLHGDGSLRAGPVELTFQGAAVDLAAAGGSLSWPAGK